MGGFSRHPHRGERCQSQRCDSWTRPMWPCHARCHGCHGCHARVDRCRPGVGRQVCGARCSKNSWRGFLKSLWHTLAITLRALCTLVVGLLARIWRTTGTGAQKKSETWFQRQFGFFKKPNSWQMCHWLFLFKEMSEGECFLNLLHSVSNNSSLSHYSSLFQYIPEPLLIWQA